MIILLYIILNYKINMIIFEILKEALDKKASDIILAT
jgi:hypothetical protein